MNTSLIRHYQLLSQLLILKIYQSPLLHRILISCSSGKSISLVFLRDDEESPGVDIDHRLLMRQLLQIPENCIQQPVVVQVEVIEPETPPRPTSNTTKLIVDSAISVSTPRSPSLAQDEVPFTSIISGLDQFLLNRKAPEQSDFTVFKDKSSLTGYLESRGRNFQSNDENITMPTTGQKEKSYPQSMLPLPIEPDIPSSSFKIKAVSSYRLNQALQLRTRLSAFGFDLIDAPMEDNPSVEIYMPDLVFDISSAVTFLKFVNLLNNEDAFSSLFHQFSGAFEKQLLVLELYSEHNMAPLSFTTSLQEALAKFRQSLVCTLTIKLSYAPYDSAHEARLFVDQNRCDSSLWSTPPRLAD